MAGRVDPIRKQNYRLATVDGTQVFSEHSVHGIVQSCSATSAAATNSPDNRISVSARPDQHINPVVKRNDHHAVVGFQLVNKSNGRFLNVFKTKFCGSAGIKEQHNREGLINRGEVSDFLFDPLLKNAKVLAFEVADVLAIAIHLAYRHGSERSVHS